MARYVGGFWESMEAMEHNSTIPGTKEWEDRKRMEAWAETMRPWFFAAFAGEPAPDLDTLINSVTEHSGPAHILPGPAGLETLWEALTTRPDVPYGPEPGFPLVPEPPRAEDVAETEGLSSDDLTWRQKPGLL